MGRKAFVTGATGFLGLNLVSLLVERGWDVCALHRPTSDLKYLDKFPVEKVIGSIENYESLSAAVPIDTEVIFHLAASTNMWSKYNQSQYTTNVTGTANVVKVALEKQVSRLIHTSSIAAFGIHEQVITESTPSNAINSNINYLKTKFLAEEEVKKGLDLGLDAVMINPAHIMGPFDTHNWMQLFRNIYRDTLPGVPKGSGMFCYVKDVARMHLNAVERGGTGENYLLGGVQSDMKEVANRIQRLMGKKLTESTTPTWVLQAACQWYKLQSAFTKNEPLLTPEKVALLTHDILCDDQKAKSDLDFTPTPLNTIVEETYKWLSEEKLL